MSDTTIRSITTQTLDISLNQSFGIAGGAQDVAQNLLVIVELEDGTRGIGEAAPLPPFNGETQDSTAAAIAKVCASLEGADTREWLKIAMFLRDKIKTAGSARCAIETAIMDARSRREKRSLWSEFGGVEKYLDTDMTVTTQLDLDQADAEAHAFDSARKIDEAGIKVVKTKVGGRNMESDLGRILAIRRGMPNCPIILDGNAGYECSGALELLARLREHGIVPDLFEQPVAKDDIEGLKRITSQGGVPVAADESAADVESVVKLVQENAVNVVNIKLMKFGVAEALQIVALCKSMGIGLMIGGMVESVLAMSMSACFAAGQGGFTYVDLDTPMFMAENPFQGGFRQEGARLYVDGITLGHGVTVP